MPLHEQSNHLLLFPYDDDAYRTLPGTNLIKIRKVDAPKLPQLCFAVNNRNKYDFGSL